MSGYWHRALAIMLSLLSQPPSQSSPPAFPPQRLHLRITSTLYVALISPTLLNTRQVYFPLSSGFRFFRFSVHFFFLFSPISWGVRGLLSFSHVMSGRGFPLATHFRRMELPTGRAITLRLIFAGCVNLGRAAKGMKNWLWWAKGVQRMMLLSSVMAKLAWEAPGRPKHSSVSPSYQLKLISLERRHHPAWCF